MDGFYFDPNHGGCLRRVRRCKGSYHFCIDGVYGNDEPHTGEYWFALMTRRRGTKAKFDVTFVGKPVKSRMEYTATFFGDSIEWDDGNVWWRMYVNPLQLASPS